MKNITLWAGAALLASVTMLVGLLCATLLAAVCTDVVNTAFGFDPPKTFGDVANYLWIHVILLYVFIYWNTDRGQEIFYSSRVRAIILAPFTVSIGVLYIDPFSDVYFASIFVGLVLFFYQKVVSVPRIVIRR